MARSLQDTQIFLQQDTGHLLSADHGDWGPDAPDQGGIVHCPGLPQDAPNKAAIDAAVSRVQALDDEALLEDVSNMPDDHEWQAAMERRLRVAEWLASRRDTLDQLMATWRQ